MSKVSRLVLLITWIVVFFVLLGIAVYGSFQPAGISLSRCWGWFLAVAALEAALGFAACYEIGCFDKSGD